MIRRNGGKGKLAKADWLLDALRACKPPDTMTVTQFADSYRLLDRENSKPFNSALTPYIIGVQDAFTDQEIEQLWFVKPTQVGGTRAIFNMIAYIIAQDPDDTMVVYPTLELALYNSKNRIQPMILNSPVLRVLYLERESTDLELHFSNGMILVLAGANSAASLASRPIRYLFLDEVDKYPACAGVEADPIKLATERTKTFPHNRKIVGTSTPTFRTGNVWKYMEAADQVRRYFAPCPHCGHLQEFCFAQLHWPKDANATDAGESSWYQCVSCKGRITDPLKPTMVRDGHWQVVEQRNPGSRMTAFHLNTFPSPWVRFGDIAREFLASKESPEDLQNFINSWLAEPWENTVAKTSSDLVMERTTEYPEGVIPDQAQLLTGGVDYQPIQGLWYWTIRAWGPLLTSWNVAHGVAHSWAAIEQVMNTPWRKRSGEEMLVNLCAIDSGDETEAVYDFCASNMEWAIPVKGSSVALQTPYTQAVIDKTNSRAYGMRRVNVNTQYYKDMIAGRLNRPNGSGAWMVHADCDREYAQQVTAEQKVKVRKNGREVDVWQPKTTHAANHYLDAEVYAACAADLRDVRYLQEPSPDSAGTTPARTAPSPSQATDENPWLAIGDSWL